MEMMQGPRMGDGNIFDVMPVPIDPAGSVYPMTPNQGPTLVGVDPSIQDNPYKKLLNPGTMKEGGVKYQGMIKLPTKGGKGKFKAGGTKPRGFCNPRKDPSNRYGR